MKKKVRKKLKQVDKRSAQQKCEEMFGELHIDMDVGRSAIRALSTEMKRTLKPMGGLADRAIEFFKDKMDDEHTSILFAVFGLLFSRILFDPTVGCVTMTKIKKKGDGKDEEKEAGRPDKRIIIP